MGKRDLELPEQRVVRSLTYSDLLNIPKSIYQSKYTKVNTCRDSCPEASQIVRFTCTISDINYTFGGLFTDYT